MLSAVNISALLYSVVLFYILLIFEYADVKIEYNWCKAVFELSLPPHASRSRRLAWSRGPSSVVVAQARSDVPEGPLMHSRSLTADGDARAPFHWQRVSD